MHSPVIYERRFVRAYGIFALPRRLLLNGKKAEPILHSAGAVPFSERESAATASLDVVGSLGRTKGEKIWPAAVVVVRSTTLGKSALCSASVMSVVYTYVAFCFIAFCPSKPYIMLSNWHSTWPYCCILSAKALHNAVQLTLYVAFADGRDNVARTPLYPFCADRTTR